MVRGRLRVESEMNKSRMKFDTVVICNQADKCETVYFKTNINGITSERSTKYVPKFSIYVT